MRTTMGDQDGWPGTRTVSVTDQDCLNRYVWRIAGLHLQCIDSKSIKYVTEFMDMSCEDRCSNATELPEIMHPLCGSCWL